MIKKVWPVFFLSILLAGLLSCGLEEYYYIHYVPQSDIDMQQTNTATIKLPASSSEGYSTYFTNFVIFYRIYITCDNSIGRIDTPEQRTTISTSLASDWSSLNSSTDTTSTSVNTNIGSTFSNRKYYPLVLEGTNIDNLLGSSNGSLLGGTLVIHFLANTGEWPTLTVNNGTPYRLIRSNNGGVFSPLPADRYFLNTTELCDSANVTPQINDDIARIDTANQQASDSGAARHAYVSMYIAAMGLNIQSLTTIYSIPTFIGVFKLP
ncbi:MAG: hypothetical protein LBD48_13030 [Treponema sp.]|jgi:hypothetical protein|nr:hypothetical protein [Treponema sp.]